MSGSDPNGSPFLTAIHEAGHFLAGSSLGIKYAPLILTIQPYKGSVGSTLMAFDVNPLPFNLHVPWCLGGLIAESIFSIREQIESGEIKGKLPPDIFSKTYDRIGHGSHTDIDAVYEREDCDDSVIADGVLKCLVFMFDHAKDLFALGTELVERKTLFHDESLWFLRSQTLFLRHHRQTAPPLLSKNGEIRRPDLTMQESIPMVLQRMGRDWHPFLEWMVRHDGAYERTVVPG